MNQSELGVGGKSVLRKGMGRPLPDYIPGTPVTHRMAEINAWHCEAPNLTSIRDGQENGSDEQTGSIRLTMSCFRSALSAGFFIKLKRR